MNPRLALLQVPRTRNSIHRSLLLIAAIVSLLSGASPPAAGQEVALGEPVAAHAEAFGLIRGVRELSDGRVLVADPLGRALFRLDADLRAAQTLGSEGEGPREYLQPDGLWPIGSDRSLLVDLGNARLTEVGPDGQLGDSSPIVLSEGSGPGGMMLAIPGGTDNDGHVYFAGSPFSPDGMRDSVDVFRLDRSTGDYERVATIRAPEITEHRSGAAIGIRRVPLGRLDAWGVTASGELYVARERDYSVEFIWKDGRTTKGPASERRGVRIGGAEKNEWADERARNGGIAVDVGNAGGEPRVSMGRSTGRRSDVEDLPWPDRKPPFVGSGIRVDPEGRAWIRRSEAAGRPALYDVFDQEGRLQYSVRFPEGRTLLAFGRSSLYAASTDELDQQFLERYSMP